MTWSFRPLSDTPGEPSAATLELLAPWIVAASRPFADWYLGGPELAAEILQEWMARPTSEVFVGRAIVCADDGGRPVGCIIALPGSELAACRAADFAEFCSEVEFEPEALDVITEVVAVSNELFAPVAADDLYISRVGVDTDRRGNGIGRAMVAHVLDRFRGEQLATCRLDVSADNLAAIRAYEAAGLTVVETRHSVDAGLSYCAMTTTL